MKRTIATLLLISCICTLSGCWPAAVARIHHKRQEEREQAQNNSNSTTATSVTTPEQSAS